MVLSTSDKLCTPSEARLLNQSHVVIVFWSAIKRRITSVDPDELKQCIRDIRAAYHTVVELSQGLLPEDIVNATDTLRKNYKLNYFMPNFRILLMWFMKISLNNMM